MYAASNALTMNLKTFFLIFLIFPERHRQICRRHNGDRPDHRQRWDGLQRGGEYPDKMVVRRTTSHSTSTRTKELVVDYRRQSREHTPITIDKTPVERVNSFKFPRRHITRISHGLLTQMQCWRRHISVSSSWGGLRKFGTSPRILRSFYTCTVESILTAVSPPGLETAPLATAGLCQRARANCPPTLLEVSFPPSRISPPGGVQGRKPGGLSKTPATRPTVCSLCCP